MYVYYFLGRPLVVLTSFRGGQPAEAMKNEFEYVWLKSAVESEPSDGNPSMCLFMSLLPHTCYLHRQPSFNFR